MVKFPVLVLMLFCLYSTAVMAAVNDHGACEQAWDRVLGGSVSKQLSDQITYWKSLSNQCAGSGLYEYRLSNLYLRAQQYKAARKELESALKRHLPHKRELLLGMADVTSQTKNFREARHHCEQLIHEYPDWYVGYREMGTIYILDEKFKDAIPFLLKANKIEENWYTYRNLVVAYFNANQNQSAIAAFNKAYNLNNAVASDRTLMLIGANAYMNERELDTAHRVLLLLAQNDPAAKSDPTYIKLYRDIESALRNQK